MLVNLKYEIDLTSNIWILF